MLKSSSLVDLTSRHQLRSGSGPPTRSGSIHLAKENLNIRNFNNIFREYHNSEDNIEKTKKKRVILKSRQKFPSDFFNEASDTLDGQESQRFPLRCESSKPIKAKRSNSTASDNTAQTKTPKFSSGMSIFSHLKGGDINTNNDNNMQASSSKLLTEEYDDVYLPSQFPIAKVYKLARSQSLVCHQTETLKIPLPRHEIPNGILSENYSRLETDTYQHTSDIEASPIEKRDILRSRSVNKRRMSSFSGFQNSLGIERLRSEANASGYKDIDNSSQLSTDISRKIFSRENQRNYSDKVLETSNNDLEPYGRAVTPEKVLVNLPSIKKEVNKLDLGRLSRQNNFMAVVPSSFRESESVHTERPYYRVGSSYCSATKPMNMPPRIQSQGGKLECFGRRDGMRSLMSGAQSGQKMESSQQTIFSTKTMVRFHNSIIKVLNQNIPCQKLQHGDIKEGEDLKKQDNKEDVVNMLSMKPVEVVNEENLAGQNEGVVKEKRDPCEFSFSKNFYKDKSRSVLGSVLQNSIGEQERIGKKLREPNQEYLKSKSKIFVDSDIKRKFSIVRVKQMQS